MRYDRHFDYGMRGYPDAPPPRDFEGSPVDERRSRERLGNRVTSRYNADYVYGGRGSIPPPNYNMYTGDRPGRIGDERYYRKPYRTIGGTHTWRGSNEPIGYDYPYGGRRR
ncbi:MAG TPA: hypothetical protein VFI91_02515 [Longimicrobiaceae bacterium]|nr:hypothetical protein [Longimicrobiaceae bacterium]